MSQSISHNSNSNSLSNNPDIDNLLSEFDNNFHEVESEQIIENQNNNNNIDKSDSNHEIKSLKLNDSNASNNSDSKSTDSKDNIKSRGSLNSSAINSGSTAAAANKTLKSPIAVSSPKKKPLSPSKYQTLPGNLNTVVSNTNTNTNNNSNSKPSSNPNLLPGPPPPRKKSSISDSASSLLGGIKKTLNSAAEGAKQNFKKAEKVMKQIGEEITVVPNSRSNSSALSPDAQKNNKKKQEFESPVLPGHGEGKRASLIYTSGSKTVRSPISSTVNRSSLSNSLVRKVSNSSIVTHEPAKVLAFNSAQLAFYLQTQPPEEFKRVLSSLLPDLLSHCSQTQLESVKSQILAFPSPKLSTTAAHRNSFTKSKTLTMPIKSQSFSQSNAPMSPNSAAAHYAAHAAGLESPSTGNNSQNTTNNNNNNNNNSNNGTQSNIPARVNRSGSGSSNTTLPIVPQVSTATATSIDSNSALVIDPSSPAALVQTAALIAPAIEEL